jgi:hypothetical protein
MSDRNVTELLKRLISENPDADPESIFRLFVAEAGEHWDEISRVWFRDVSDTLDRLTPQEIPEWLRPH